MVDRGAGRHPEGLARCFLFLCCFLNFNFFILFWQMEVRRVEVDMEELGNK